MARALAKVSRSIADQTPRDHEDAAIVVRHTGNEPGAILRWVQENTRHVAYPGLLRGAAGVLMDRCGNSLDRALFTADLLKRAGHVVRLARARLSKQAASALRGSLASSVPSPQPRPNPDPAELTRTFGSVPLAPGALDRAIAATVKDAAAFTSTLRDQQAKIAPALAAAIGSVEQRDAELASEAEEVLADHFWVQRQAGAGWEDLDPDAAAVGHLVPTGTLGADQVPDELKHHVTLRIRFESWQEGRASETVVFEKSWVAADLLGKTLTLRHRLLPQPPLDPLLSSADPAGGYVRALSNAWVIEPFVMLGTEEVTDRLYTLRGEALPANQATKTRLGFASQPLASVGSQVATGFTQAFGGPPPAETPKPPDEAAGPVRISAEWLDVEIGVPGRPVEQHRRAVFDLLGPTARTSGKLGPPKIDAAAKERRALALAGETGAIVAGASPGDDWLTRLAAQHLAAGLEQAASLEAATPVERTAMVAQEPLQLPLWSWATSRSRNAVLPPAPPVAPNVALLWSTPVRDPGGAQRFKVAFDIVSNRTATDLSYAHRIAQGVLDTSAEHLVFGSTREVTNAAALHALDLSAGRPWVRLDPGDTGSVDRLQISQDARARLREHLKGGYLVVARSTTTSDAPSAAWWRIDPRSGTTVGIGENGLGTAAPESGFLTGTRILNGGVCAFFFLGETLHAGRPTASGTALAAFCIAGAIHAHSVGALVGEGVIDLIIHLITSTEGPEGESGGH